MQQQVILNFLNLSGVVGLGLIDGHSRPYFSGIDKSLNFQQKEALTQGIQQVISTTPSGFDSFDFKFAQQDAWIYRLKNGVILLVVTDHQQLDTLVYNDTVAQLKETLESDPHNAVSTFRLLAGSTTLNRSTDGTNESSSPAADTPTSRRSPGESSGRASALSAQTPATWNDCLAALNTLTDVTAQYLGKIVVANTWRATRPDEEALTIVHLDRGGHFSLEPDGQVMKTASIEERSYTAIRDWVSAFVKRCSMIIRDYEAMVIEQQLTAQQRAVLQIEQPASE